VASDLQLLVDQLSSRIGAAVVLEDHEQRAIAHSSQAGPIDWVRRESVLHRSTSPELVSWFRSFGIATSRDIVRIPANPALEILPRVCAPVRYRGRLLGFLWLIDAEVAFSAADFLVIEKAAEHAALLLYEERLAGRLVGQAFTHLLSPSEELREAAAMQLVDQSLARDGEPTAVVVVQPIAEGVDLRIAIDEALFDVAWDAPTGSFLRLAQADHGVLLVQFSDASDDKVTESLAHACRQHLERRVAGTIAGGTRVIATIGDPQTELTKVVTSYRQARQAMRVASTIPVMGDVVRWRDLGVFRALAQLPNREAVASAIDPRVTALLRSGDDALVTTLETYLDLACDARATASHLHLHRGTLYYRLEKASRLAGVDMGNGYDRLSVHLGLKLARLAGQPVPGRPVHPSGAT
jgi:DNA-binding PucR family transcriptional regulator